MATPRKIILIHKRAPGDIAVLTALVRDIALTHPGQFEIDVDTSAADLWLHNPHITPFRKDKLLRKGAQHVKIDYGRGIRDQNYETVHFLAYFHRDFERQCKTNVPLQLPYPDLHLSAEERSVRPVEGRYWVVISGGKSDFPIKVWDVRKMQQVVHGLNDMGLGAVQIGSTDKGHWHPPLEGALNLVGQTNLRDMLQLIHHADGVVCGVTAAMHFAAGLHRPCVVVGGGREAWWWEAYVRQNKGLIHPEKLQMPHRYLHTIGLLECCKYRGCWRNKVIKFNTDKSLCLQPVLYPEQPVPRCMDMIQVEHVMAAIQSYYTDNSLPPISTDPQSFAQQVTQAANQAVSQPSQVRSLLSLFDDIPSTVNVPPVLAPQSPPNSKPGQHHKAQTVVKLPPGLKLGTKLNGRPGAPKTAAMKPGVLTTAPANSDQYFEHPDVGGKFTVCVLLYGPEKYFDLHKRCLGSIIKTAPPGRVDIRVGSNELNPKSVAMVDQLVREGRVRKHYRHVENAYKYPVMREMFTDSELPIETKWVIWFDDDSLADRDPNWLGILAQAIIQHHRADNAHMFGAKFTWTLQPGQREWYESRPWWRGKQWRLSNGREAANGNQIIFATGGWWAITHEAIVACDIPDIELRNNGGDCAIGEALHQGGFEVKAFNGKKQFIRTSSVERRGASQPHPGTAEWRRMFQTN